MKLLQHHSICSWEPGSTPLENQWIRGRKWSISYARPSCWFTCIYWFNHAYCSGIWSGSPSRIMWRKWAEFCSLLIVALGKRIVWISAAYQVALTSVILRWCRFWDWQMGTVLAWDFSTPLRCSRNDKGGWLVTCSWWSVACSWQESLSTSTEILRLRLRMTSGCGSE